MKADFHIHSNFSDGNSSPEEIVDIAISRGINCICIVDHEEVKGAIKAMEYAFDKDILVIPGIEISSRSGDILGINIKKKIPDNLSAEETINEIKKQNGFSSIPHAFHWPTNHFLGGKKKILDIMPDAIEVFNASSVYNLANKKALDFAQANNFCFTAGSDSHNKKFIGRGYIELRNVASAEQVIEEIRSKRIKIGGEKLSLWEIYNNYKGTGIWNHLFSLVKKGYN